jgi:ribonucleoside-diphosphate reductase alpha chain
VIQQALTGLIEPSPEARADFKRTPFVTHRFELGKSSVDRLRSTPWSFGFGAFSEVVYHDNYARQKADKTLETWPDTILRVVNGDITIRKDWFLKNRLKWDEGRWQELGEEMALAFLKLKCGPPGRGYFAMGTDFVYERGSMALYNCMASKVMPETFDKDIGFIMDGLLHGSGVGIECIGRLYRFSMPTGAPKLYVVPDTKEGWVESAELLIRSYLHGNNPIEFDYDEIRKEGSIIVSFGGVCPGPEPLRKLHARLRMTIERYINGEISAMRLVADIGNMVGCCIVAGGVRRSAEVLIGDPDDREFWDLKDYDQFPERAEWGWVSNNSVRMSESKHFRLIPEIAQRIVKNGEPGIYNLISTQKYGRFGKEMPDPADLANPCLEIPLCNKEVCNIDEVYPSRCDSDAEILRSMELATIYCSNVTLLPTHRPETNAVISRNRRIGVGLSGVSDWEAKTTVADMTCVLRAGYKAVVATNAALAAEAGVNPSIRVTTIKPSGTVSLLAGVSPGGHFALAEYYIRRKRVSVNSPYRALFEAAGYPFEKAVDGDQTLVFEFPLAQPGVRTEKQAGMWEQSLKVCELQREWSSNSVSYSITFDRKTEGPQVGNMLAQIAPMVKTVCAFPRQSAEESDYEQLPVEAISKREFLMRKKMVKPIDWGAFREVGTGEADKFCNTAGGVCELPKKEEKRG